MNSNGRMILDEKFKEERIRLLTAQVQKFANLPGAKKLEKATEFTLGLFSQVALLGPTGLPAAEISALSEASQMMYGALKTECINAVQLATKTGLPPESFAGLANVVREFPETLVVAIGCDKEIAKIAFDIISKDPELIKKEGSIAKAFEKVASTERSTLSFSESSKVLKIENFAEGKLQKHFNKHVIKRLEWGANNSMNMEQYLDKARNLLNSPIDGHTIDGFTSKNGFVFRYNKVTNELATAKSDGTIETLFCPQDGMAYWEEQIKKYRE